MNLSHTMHDGTLVICLEGDSLDASRTQLFKQQVMELIQRENTYRLVLDLSALRFIDSSGLGALLSILRHVNAHDGDLKLAGMSDTVRTMFELVRMHRLFDILPTIEDCCRSFAAY